jgi:hypothetical protein
MVRHDDLPAIVTPSKRLDGAPYRSLRATVLPDVGVHLISIVWPAVRAEVESG